jgi:hypothetical protein
MRVAINKAGGYSMTLGVNLSRAARCDASNFRDTTAGDADISNTPLSSASIYDETAPDHQVQRGHLKPSRYIVDIAEGRARLEP